LKRFGIFVYIWFLLTIKTILFMKTKQLILSGLFMFSALTLQAQTITTTQSITRVGENSGNYGSGNAFYGYRAGLLATEFPAAIGGNNNTFIGNRAGIFFTGSNNVFIGFDSRIKNPVDRVNIAGDGNVFIGANTGI